MKFILVLLAICTLSVTCSYSHDNDHDYDHGYGHKYRHRSYVVLLPSYHHDRGYHHSYHHGHRSSGYGGHGGSYVETSRGSEYSMPQQVNSAPQVYAAPQVQEQQEQSNTTPMGEQASY